MHRISLTGDDRGKWFDCDDSIEFKEATRWNGNNHISRATGSQWAHEALHYTSSGRWVLHHSSSWQGSLDCYNEVDLGRAVEWLINNECMDDEGIDKLPEEVREAVEAAIETAEV